MTDLYSIHKVFSDWFLCLYMFDLYLENFYVDRTSCFSQIVLQSLISDVSLKEFILSHSVRDFSSSFDLSLVDIICFTKELEDVLAIDWFSSSDIAAQTIKFIRYEEDLAISFEADIFLLLKIQLSSYKLLQKL